MVRPCGMPMKTFSFTPEVLTLDAAAHYLSVSKRQIEEYVAKGTIPAIRLPAAAEGHLRRARIRKVDLDLFIERSIGA